MASASLEWTYDEPIAQERSTQWTAIVPGGAAAAMVAVGGALAAKHGDTGIALILVAICGGIIAATAHWTRSSAHNSAAGVAIMFGFYGAFFGMFMVLVDGEDISVDGVIRRGILFGAAMTFINVIHPYQRNN